MKTIFDAVNELKADLGNTHCYNPSDSFFLYYDTGSKSNNWASFLNHNDVANSQFTFVGDINEFNALVDAMSTNFGECSPLNVSDYKIVIKTLLKPEPTKPESNTYTQEMSDSGVLPSVGMECLINFPDIDDVWYEYTIDFMGNYTFIASCEDVSERFGYVDDVHFKPIKPLTPPVPLITGKAYQFECQNGDAVVGIYSEPQQSFDNYGIKYYPWHCTNIQPLTVEGK